MLDELVAEASGGARTIWATDETGDCSRPSFVHLTEVSLADVVSQELWVELREPQVHIWLRVPLPMCVHVGDCVLAFECVRFVLGLVRVRVFCVQGEGLVVLCADAAPRVGAGSPPLQGAVPVHHNRRVGAGGEGRRKGEEGREMGGWRGARRRLPTVTSLRPPVPANIHPSLPTFTRPCCCRPPSLPLQICFRAPDAPDMAIVVVADNINMQSRKHQMVFRRGRLDCKTSWQGTMEDVRYFAAPSSGTTGADDVLWAPEEALSGSQTAE